MNRSVIIKRKDALVLFAKIVDVLISDKQMTKK